MSNLITVSNVRGYIDENGTAQLNLEDISRGLGFTQEKNGVQYVRWERVNGYLYDMGFSPLVGKEYIPENVVYRLCMKAENEIAELFQAKIADEILPTIRKTGTYSVQPKLPQTYAEALRELATVWEENQALLPKGQAYDSFIGKENLYTVAVVAKKLAFKNMGPNQLFAFLRERNIFCSSKSKWNEPYADYVSAGYFVLRDGAPWMLKGVEQVEKQTFVTPKGVEFIDRMLKKSGYVQVGTKSDLVLLYL